MKVLSIEKLKQLIQCHGLDHYFLDLMQTLREDFSQWQAFNKMPRPAFHVPDGVIELMPIANDSLFSFKYVNGHPKNPLKGKQTVVATGQLSRVEDGYPIFLAEMTLLTALRTAATSALASDLLARKNATTLAMIGNGCQSDFQVLAHAKVRDIKTIRYHDIDAKAMTRFAKSMQGYGFDLIPCASNEEAVTGADIVVVCTACKDHVDVIENDWVKPGMHLSALGGDCPGKTELQLEILPRSKVVVEYFEQSLIEGEIQRYTEKQARAHTHAELAQLITGEMPARETEHEITLFDSVGFAIEDYSVLRLTYELCCQYGIFEEIDLVPDLSDPKDLFSVIAKEANKETFIDRLAS